MKTAKTFSPCFTISCPYCKKAVQNPDPSNFENTKYRFEATSALPKVIICAECNNEFKTPKNLSPQYIIKADK